MAASAGQEVALPKPWPENSLLAKRWESDGLIRAIFRTNKSCLLAWLKPTLVGVASLRALALNKTAVTIALDVWCQVTTQAKSPPVDWLKQEAGPTDHVEDPFTQGIYNNNSCLVSQPPCKPVQVTELYGMLSAGADESRSVAIYVDAWGLKRLISLAIRRWKAPIHRLRVSQLQYYIN